jgi:hypothetical protein
VALKRSGEQPSAHIAHPSAHMGYSLAPAESSQMPQRTPGGLPYTPRHLPYTSRPAYPGTGPPKRRTLYPDPPTLHRPAGLPYTSQAAYPRPPPNSVPYTPARLPYTSQPTYPGPPPTSVPYTRPPASHLPPQPAYPTPALLAGSPYTAQLTYLLASLPVPFLDLGSIPTYLAAYSIYNLSRLFKTLLYYLYLPYKILYFPSL